MSLVEVYATVTDRSGEALLSLTAADFVVSEDNIPQTVTTFAAGDFALSVVIALDRSFSMAGAPLVLAKTAAQSFIASLDPNDEVTVLAIGGDVQTIVPMTPAAGVRNVPWGSVDAWGTTPLYDVTARALDTIREARGRRALLLISDGVDRESETTAAQLVERARRSDVLIYPIGLGRVRSPVFADLAAVSGGRSFVVSDPKRLQATLATIGRELRSQYLLGYVPSRPAPEGGEEWRSIHVAVTTPGARVRARDGYMARR